MDMVRSQYTRGNATFVVMSRSRCPQIRSGMLDHFCQHAYDSCRKCNKCPLWTRLDERNDKARVALVAQNEANRLWEESLLQQRTDRTPSGPNGEVGGPHAPVNVNVLIQAGAPESRRARWLRLLKRRNNS